MEVFTGRPGDETGRLSKECRVYDLLEALGISYLRVDHPAAMTMEGCREADAALGGSICKNLLLCNRQQTEFYLLMLPGAKSLRTSELSRSIGSSRLSFAPGEWMERLLDITPGSLSVLGLMNDRENRVRLLMDRDLLAWESFGCHPCVNTTSLRLSMGDLLEKILPATGHEPRFVTVSEK